MDDSLPIIISTFDGIFAAGTIGLATNQVAGAYFDNIDVKPLSCTNLLSNSIDNHEGLLYTPPLSNRFKESYKTDIAEQWKIIEPDTIEDGPSQWKIQKDYNGKKKVILQDSQAFAPNGHMQL